ncbi:bifunctional 4-hydroxy-2-oxoglutarate aldolase/2-dehydro-3-deoxy-phosphogluconate aldolase [Synechococcus sp. CCY9201]|uniref:bifunctional 4-hydroxy-2-oxoglutarate aldolase/2-dehydro-3-deoxy-phosphogluconate aldolase n=1 Tax=Synechococcus sp. CCY9201 TaxID=174697 RepID=UPI002B209BB9|nr:bifunctional 4-hydroxy-2-oxoglutarate aldolase/2-dehydro-3-deoxy-phosphogluconate aldolase [Synechococcus sp. CCY9201]
MRPSAAVAADPAGLIPSLRRQPLLLVLRPQAPLDAAPLLERLVELGLRHVELAFQESPHWRPQCRELIAAFPGLRLGAASVCTVEALADCSAAGFSYVVSPILDGELVQQAAAAGITLVPGVMSPTEVHQARLLGSPLVKLFPAHALGRAYWSGLRAPLGALPFCIAAGGLSPADAIPWLRSGVDAVALGSSLSLDRSDDLPCPGEEPDAAVDPLEPLRLLLVELGRIGPASEAATAAD